MANRERMTILAVRRDAKGHEKTEELVEVEVNFLAIVRQVGAKAVWNRSGVATAMRGAVKVKHLGSARK